MRLIAFLIFILAASQSGAFSYATGDCATDGCAETEGWLHTNANEIAVAISAVEASTAEAQSLYKYADPATPGTTTAGLAEALAECGNGIGGGSVTQGCTVKLACNTDDGGLDISNSVTIGGTTTATAKVGVRIVGCGTGVDNSNEDVVGGSTLNWSGGADPMLIIDGCSGCALEDFGIRGNDDATGGVVLRGTAAPTSFTSLIDLRFEDINGYAIEIDGGTGDDDQIDNIHMERVSIRDSVGCYLQDSEQSLNNAFMEGECSSVNADPLPSGHMFNILQGNVTIGHSYFGIRNSHSPAIDIGRPAFAYILGNSFEFHRTNGVAIMSDGSGGSGGNNDATVISGNKFLVLNTGASCVDWNRQGALVFSGNVMIGQGSGADAGCVLTAENTADGDDIFVTSFGNSHRTLYEAADFVASGVSSSLEYGLLPWSTDADAFVSQLNGPAATATALAANGGNCSAGSYPLGVDASGATESCTDATTEIDAVVATKSAASSTDNTLPRFHSTAGDIQTSGVVVDDSDNMNVPGSLTTGGTEVPSCLILRDSDDGGDSACAVLNGTFSCETDTNGVCGDAT